MEVYIIWMVDHFEMFSFAQDKKLPIIWLFEKIKFLSSQEVFADVIRIAIRISVIKLESMFFLLVYWCCSFQTHAWLRLAWNIKVFSRASCLFFLLNVNLKPHWNYLHQLQKFSNNASLSVFGFQFKSFCFWGFVQVYFNIHKHFQKY